MAISSTFTTGQVFTAADANLMANSGLVYVTSGALSTATTDFVGCFTSTYDNYRIIISDAEVNSAADIYFRMLSGTTPSVVDYSYVCLGANIAATTLNTYSTATAQAEGYTGWTTTATGTGTNVGALQFDIFSPLKTKRTFFLGSIMSYQSNFKHGTTSIVHNNQGSFNGLRIATLTAATMAGTATIYGYRKA